MKQRNRKITLLFPSRYNFNVIPLTLEMWPHFRLFDFWMLTWNINIFKVIQTFKSGSNIFRVKEIFAMTKSCNLRRLKWAKMKIVHTSMSHFLFQSPEVSLFAEKSLHGSCDASLSFWVSYSYRHQKAHSASFFYIMFMTLPEYSGSIEISIRE